MPSVELNAYPPGTPTITNDQLSLSVFLQNPQYVHRAITDLTLQRYLADQIYSRGPAATGGAAIYDQVTASDLFLSRDVKAIRPAGEYPILNDTIPTPLVAPVAKWGGRVFITDEDVRRNRIDVINRELTKLRNTIVRKVDQVAIATLTAAPIQTYGFGSTWTTSGTDILGGIMNAKLLVDQLDMGYELDTLVLNYAQADALLGRADIRTAFGLMAQENIVRNASLGKLLNLNIYATNRVAAGTGFLMQAGAIGGISDEVPLQTKVYRTDDSDVTWVQASRVFVPYITDPKAVVQLTGL